MKYELSVLDDLIKQATGYLSHEPLGREWEAQLLRAARAEQEQIQKRILEQVFRLQTEQSATLCIRHHQTRLLQSGRVLWPYVISAEADRAGGKAPADNFPEKLYLISEALLFFLQQHFPDHFNEHADLPEGYAAGARQEIREKLVRMEAKYRNHQVSPLLLEIARHPLQRFARSDPPGSCTFQQLDYFNLLAEELMRIRPSGDSQAQTQQLTGLLLYLNFNSFRFFSFCVGMYSTNLQETDGLAGQVEKLAFLQKEINQAPVKPGVCLKEAHASIKVQLQNWIAEELYYREKRYQPASVRPVTETAGEEKLKVNLSVSQLAYWARLWLDAGIITGTQLSSLLRFLCRHIQTIHADNISFDSLRAKYYNPEQSTKASVNNLLIRMLNLVRKK
jgi:hypothetical protein